MCENKEQWAWMFATVFLHIMVSATPLENIAITVRNLTSDYESDCCICEPV